MTRPHDEALVEAVAKAIAIANHLPPEDRTPEREEKFLRVDMGWFTLPEVLEDFEIDEIEGYRELARAALSAMEAASVVEWGIMRPASMPDMSGVPQYTQIVSATFRSIKDAENARKHVPALRGVPAIICERTAPGPWRPVEQEARPAESQPVGQPIRRPDGQAEQ